MKRFGLLFLMIMLVVGCGQRNKKPSMQKFTMPEIPSYLTSPQDRAAYSVGHWWDKFDFADTSLINRPEIAEQAFADFANTVAMVDSATVSHAVDTMLTHAERADSAMFRYFLKLCDKYFNDPNSPMRNETAYLGVLNYMIDRSLLSEIEKTRPRYQREMALKNRPGTVAADFTCFDVKNTKIRLHALADDYTLLMFYNPGCPNCQQIKDHIAASPVFTTLLANQVKGLKFKLLAVYSDKDIEAWRKDLPSIEKGWIVGQDCAQTINDGKLYDLRAIPTLYLLDGDKKVIFKDAPVQVIEEYLVRMVQQKNNSNGSESAR